MDYLVHDHEGFTHYADANALLAALGPKAANNGLMIMPTIAPGADISSNEVDGGFRAMLCTTGFETVEEIAEYLSADPEDDDDKYAGCWSRNHAEELLDAISEYQRFVTQYPDEMIAIYHYWHDGSTMVLRGEEQIVYATVHDAGQAGYVTKDMSEDDAIALCSNEKDVEKAREHGFLSEDVEVVFEN